MTIEEVKDIYLILFKHCTIKEHGSETSRPLRKLGQTYQPTDNLSTNHGPTNRQSLTIIRFIYAEWQWFCDIGKTTCSKTKPWMQIYKSLFQTSMERKRIYLKTFKAQIRFSINICNVRSSKQSSFIQTMFIHPNNDPTWLGAGWRHNESCRVLRFTQGSSNQ